MSLKAGIIGLPNVGKSTLFSAITNIQVEIANYPFVTIEPNIGIVKLDDYRMEKLISIFKPEKSIYTTFKFCDIAGLISGASKGEGLGNKFLSNIRDVDVICMVIRCFENDNIIHIENNIDPIRDIEIINLELIISDLEKVEKKIDKIKKKLKNLKELENNLEYNLLLKINNFLSKNKLLKDFKFNEEEKKYINDFNFLTIKPFIYVANIDEETFLLNKDNKYINELKKYSNKNSIDLVVFSIKLEYELSLLSKYDKKNFINEFNINNSGLQILIEKTFNLLNLKTFFTAGNKEVRSWSFKNGMNALDCSALIHSDFKKGFIKADVYSYNDLINLGNEILVKQKGKIRSEGKNYLIKDGDICFFKFNL